MTGPITRHRAIYIYFEGDRWFIETAAAGSAGPFSTYAIACRQLGLTVGAAVTR